MTDLDKINIGIRLWDYDLKARIEAETDFKKYFERLPTKKEILSIFFDNLSNLSKNQTVKVKEICDAAIVLMAEMGGAPTSERGFEDSIYWNFFTKVEKSYALSKWHTQYSDGEIIVCVKILGEIGDLRSLGLLVYGFDYIYDEEGIYDPVQIKLTECVEETVILISKNTKTNEYNETLITLLTEPISMWIDESPDCYIGTCLDYTKKHLKILSKKRIRNELKYQIKDGLRFIKILENQEF